MIKPPQISEMRTIGVLQTNAPKILYGSGIVGAGRKDVYQDFKSVRGRFTEKTAMRTLGNGTVIPVAYWEYVVRFEIAIMNVIDLQLRFEINGKVYTMDSYSVEQTNKTDYIAFKLSQFGK